MKKLPIRLLVITLAVTMLAVISACGKEEPVIEPEPGPDPIEITAEDEPEPIVEEPAIIYPYKTTLTGEGSMQKITDRPVVVMIENSKDARPQSGLHEADIIYETLAEGNITRFVAVYQSQAPELIGPVRSIRPYLIRIGDSLDAIIVHAGWSPEAETMLKTIKRPTLNFLLADHIYSWRSKDRKAPHNLYTSMENIRKGADAKKYATDSKEINLLFAQDDAEYIGEEATNVKINYIQGYDVSYEYDEEGGYYERFMLGDPHQDKETETQLIAHNIIIMESRHKITDNIGRRDIDVVGPGDGYLVQKGKARKITWDGTDGFIRVFADDQQLALVPGKTWVNIVPIGTKVDIEKAEKDIE